MTDDARLRVAKDCPNCDHDCSPTMEEVVRLAIAKRIDSIDLNGPFAQANFAIDTIVTLINDGVLGPGHPIYEAVKEKESIKYAWPAMGHGEIRDSGGLRANESVQ